eukprot:gnl/MRDRNA2_/MRDRNA2_104739_c0_seq1.p1 gnl/MRDRNA2_/MRDRNA2_104739_c0~~gnl/MRDRNA2_/MRDRNA2_104739_c0_seq1.p1  ORF type:complete len:290 (-),score=62.25 gnl/MRDRNA2_/MRDRNA2_104739_c0_seq1:20-889(-)
MAHALNNIIKSLASKDSGKDANPLPKWIKLNAGVSYKSSSGKLMDVTITEISQETKAVKFTFDKDPSTWKAIPFSQVSNPAKNPLKAKKEEEPALAEDDPESFFASLDDKWKTNMAKQSAPLRAFQALNQPKSQKPKKKPRVLDGGEIGSSPSEAREISSSVERVSPKRQDTGEALGPMQGPQLGPAKPGVDDAKPKESKKTNGADERSNRKSDRAASPRQSKRRGHQESSSPEEPKRRPKKKSPSPPPVKKRRDDSRRRRSRSRDRRRSRERSRSHRRGRSRSRSRRR